MTNTEEHEPGEPRTLAEMMVGIRTVLADAHVEPAPTKRAAILGCRAEIEDARRKGMTWAQIAQLLGKAGIAVSADSLRTYVSRAPRRENETRTPSGQEAMQPQRVAQPSTPAPPSGRTRVP